MMKLHFYIAASLGLLTGAVVAENLLPNGSFEQGLKGWQTGDASSGDIEVVPLKDGPEKRAVRIDARRISEGERSLLSNPVAVDPSTSYEVRGLVKRLAGYGYRSSVAVVWKDASGKMIGVENVWCGVLLGTNWVKEVRRVIAPAAAASGQIKAGIETGLGERNAALFTGLQLVHVPASGPDMAIQLFAGKTIPGEASGFRIQLTNTGDTLFSQLKITLRLPKGMVAETAQWTCGQLGATEAWEQSVALSGYPDSSNARIEVGISAVANGKKVGFTKTTPVNAATAKPVVVSSKDLHPEAVPDMKVKLGAYYFPVMIDWGGGSRPGLRALESKEPLLGYYNERSPEVADWHIAWALQHGISWFAVDWYWNQGEEFLNEALDEGLLNSRFADQMQFCIHWCNQDPACTTFRAYDYSPETLRELAATLCDRYFSRSNYLKVDGEPVFMVFQPASLMNGNGGAVGTKAVLDAMEDVARSRGLKGIYFIAVNNSPVVPDYASAGFDAVAPYSFLFGNLLPERTDRIEFDYDKIVQQYIEWFGLNRQQVHAQGLHYVPTAWAGWDDLCRYGEHRREQSCVTAGNTPSAFRAMAQALPDHVEQESPLALVEAWNEWGEGTVIEPGKEYGFDYLSAILNVLAVEPPTEYSVPVPDQESFQRMQAPPMFIDHVRYAEAFNADRKWASGLEMAFDNKRSLWMRPAGNMDYAWIDNGNLHALAKGADGELIGPEAIWLDTAKVGGMDICLKTAAETGLALQWRTAPDAPWMESPVQHVDAGGQQVFHFDCSGMPGWKGSVYQFRWVFKDNPGQVDVDWLKTF